MTPIGHTLTGLAIGYLAIPRFTPTKPKMLLLAAFAVAASAQLVKKAVVPEPAVGTGVLNC